MTALLVITSVLFAVIAACAWITEERFIGVGFAVIGFVALLMGLA
jgi:hypothetical protein